MTPPSQTRLSLSFNQRWNHGRTTYRPPRETIRPADYEVAEIADDTLVGHTGIIYQAFNGVYLGRGTARTLRLLPDGRAFNDRSIQKIRKAERGWRSAAAVLENLGALHAPEEPEPRLNWLHSALSGLTRPVRHHSCHKYAWALTRPLKRTLPASLPFPKFVDAAL